MNLGIGLYRHMLTQENYRYARQIGCSHLVIHLVDYYRKPTGGAVSDNQPVGATDGGWGVAGNPDAIWTVDELRAIRRDIEAEGLKLEAIENFDPAFWYDVLLDGPKKQKQVEGLKQLIRNIGKAGIPIMGYNFSIAGVASRLSGPSARGGADSVSVHEVDQTPLPLGMVWNMVYDTDAPRGTLAPVTPEELWQRLAYFLAELVPIAEENNVRLAAHPDDPPAPSVRGTPRLVYRPDLYQKLIDLEPSRANALEFCVGSVAEMADGDVYEATETYSRQKRIAYVHLRNIRGRMPYYDEDFIDEGDIDIPRIIGILHRNNYEGLLIPDHTPLVSCGAPWHAGMAYAIGYMRACVTMIEQKE